MHIIFNKKKTMATLKDISNIRRKSSKLINEKSNEINKQINSNSINFSDCLFEESGDENIPIMDFQYVRLNKEETFNKNVLFDKTETEKRFLERSIKNDDKLCLINTKRNREYNNVKIRYKPYTDFTNKEYKIILKNSTEINQKNNKKRKVIFKENVEIKPHNVGDLKSILVNNNTKINSLPQKRKKIKDTIVVKCVPLFDNLQEELSPFEYNNRDE